MTKKQRAERDEKILRHGFRIQRIFPEARAGYPGAPIALCKALRRLENEAHRLAEAECSRPLPDGYVEKKEASIMRRLDRILGFTKAKIPVIFNGDPRGCALKIDDAYVREHNLEIERDLGGYGLIAPEF